MSVLSPPAYRNPSESTPRNKRKFSRLETVLGRVVLALSIVNFFAVLALLVLLCIVSERWWLSLALSYLPRLPYLFPSVMLGIAALLLRRRIAWLNLFSALLVLGPIMGFRTPLSTFFEQGSGTRLTIVSCNVQRGVGNIEAVLAEVIAAAPDLIVLQEAPTGVQPIKEHFREWHVAHSGEYLVLSRWPLEQLEACRTEGFRRATGVLYEVDAPDGRFLLYNVHLTTARYGLSKLRTDSLTSGQGVEELMEYQTRRNLEAEQTAAFVDAHRAETPLIAVGDFNMPASSSLFQQHWGEFSSAFDAAGFGYGYTSPCNTKGNSWPRNTPWLRIDHVLLSRHFSPEASWIGRTDGSDHRMIAARVRFR